MIVEYEGKRGTSFYVRVNGPDGNRFYGEPIRAWEYPNRTKAKRAAQKREAEVLNGKSFRRAPTADGYTERLLERLEQEALPNGRKRKQTTLLAVRYESKKFAQDFRGRRLDAITRAEAINWHHRATAGQLKFVHQLFNAAIDEELVERNPFRGLKKPTRSRGKDAPPTPEQFESLLTHCSVLGDYAPTFRAFLQFAGCTGMRPGELCALEWNDIDFERMRINVERTLAKGTIDLPKSGYAREIVLTPPARDALLALPRVADTVFVSKQRKRLSEVTIFTYWSLVRAAVGVDFPLYLATRHYCAHHLYVERQLPWNVVRQQLGHADQSLERVYGHGDIGWQRDIEGAFQMNVKHLRLERTANE